MSDVVISRIAVYPIKSLDGVVVQAARFLPGGALEHDREFALCDDDGRWINGKRDARIHSIRSEYDLDKFTVTLSSPQVPNQRIFHLLDDQADLENWFSTMLGIS